jgi:predicted secreted hydrolase
MVWCAANRGWLRFWNDLGELLEFSKKMKTIFGFLLISCLNIHAEWIEPPTRSSKGFLVPTADYIPTFPQDHGAHRGYALEWWYWVGHLETVNDGQEYGFQSTVFRVAGDPKNSKDSETETFGSRQLFLAHSALSDRSEKKYLHHERVLREGWQAQATKDTLGLEVAGIEARMLVDGKGHRLTTHYPGGGKLELELIPAKPLVRFGERGLSRKGDGAASVSWYWSYSRLKATGILSHNGQVQKVRGFAWMDHEISSSQLGKGLAGWDWTCMQLDDGTEVKAYRLRKDDGSSDRWSAVYWIDAKGKTQHVYADQFTWGEEGDWTSPTTGLTYPTYIRINADHPTRGKQSYRLRPIIDDQEFYGNRADNAYWEGACYVLSPDDEVIGRAYLELAGYGGGLGARLN